MKLVRKENAPVIVDYWGIEHPDVVAKIIATPEDKLNKWLKIECAYFHNDTAQKSLDYLGTFEFIFNQRTIEEAGSIWETYDQIKEDIEIDENGDIVLLNTNVPNWILGQPWVRDFEGKLFSENWVIVS
jgi:hypothetical protein